MKKCIPFLLPFLLATPAFAQKAETLEIYADRLESEGNILTATGRVVVLYENATLNADFLRFNQDDKTGLAEGSVTLRQNGSSFETDRLSFDLENRTADVGRFSGIFANEGRFRGNSLSLSPKLWKATGTSFIPCFGGDPFRFRSRALLYYPEEKKSNLVLDRMSFEVGGIPILVLPTFAWTIGEERPARKLFEFQPQAGYNAYEGFYAQGTVPYRLSPSSYGTIPVRYSTNRGVYAGIEHVHSIDERNEIRGNASYQTPWQENSPWLGGPRANLIGRHTYSGGGDLEGVLGYRSDISGLAVSRAELSSRSPMWGWGPFRTQFQGSLGGYHEDSFGTINQSPRALLREDTWYPTPFAGGNLSLYQWMSGSIYPDDLSLMTLAGARWDREWRLLGGFVGTDFHRIRGESPFTFDKSLPFDRVYGGLGLWVHQNWRLAADASYSRTLPSTYSDLDLGWGLSDLGLGIDFRAPCISWQFRLQPLIRGFRFEYQFSKF